jgi:hypothetical protein
VNYPDGKKLMVGDRLRLWEGCYGTVVASIDDDEYTPKYSREAWSYLKTGVLINTSQIELGLIHYEAPEDSFALIERNPTP